MFYKGIIRQMDALIIETHIIGLHFFDKCKQIKKAFSQYGETYLMVQRGGLIPKEYFKEFTIYLYDWKLLKQTGYKTIKESITPGSNHLITMYFYHLHPEFSNYWSLEYDVDFNGNWNVLFNTAYSFQTDFLSCHIKLYKEDINWYWWNHYINQSKEDTFNIPICHRVRSFNPIYRISNKALEYVDTALLSGVYGHHEVVIPTLLFNGGFDLMDFGGTGKFVKNGFENQLYISSSPLSIFGSMRHIEFRDLTYFSTWKNKLIHPLK